MQKNDLKQIKQIVDTSVKQIVDTSVKQIVDESLDEKLDKKFRENNKKIFKKIDGVKNKLLDSMKEEFDDNTEQHNQLNKRFDKVDKTLESKADKSTLLDWADKRILGLELDRDRMKYLHIKEWKNLPSAHKINDTLIKEGLR